MCLSLCLCVSFLIYFDSLLCVCCVQFWLVNDCVYLSLVFPNCVSFPDYLVCIYFSVFLSSVLCRTVCLCLPRVFACMDYVTFEPCFFQLSGFAASQNKDLFFVY